MAPAIPSALPYPEERGRDLKKMFLFGALSLLVGLIQFQIPDIPGGVSDLREVVILVSVLYLGHWGYLVGVAALTTLGTPADGSVLATFLMHACGGVAFWFFYHRFLSRLRGEFRYSALWLFGVMVYYLALVVPVMVLVYAAVGLIPRGAVLSTYAGMLPALRFEIAATAGMSTLFVVAHRLRSERQRALEEAYETTLEGWARALELRDRDTEGHTRRVTELTYRLGLAFGLSPEALVHLRRGAILHDIGKMGVPDRILLKPGEPTEEEWEAIRQHPDHARRLLEPIAFLRPALDIPYGHHEKWDGTGYPRGLKGSEIPFAARLFAVADVWDALSSDRPYRGAWEPERVEAYLRENTGSHFDPRVVEVFLTQVVARGPRPRP